MSLSDPPGLGAAADALARRLLADAPPDRPRTRADLDRLPAPVACLLHARLDGQTDAAARHAASPWVDPDVVGPAFRAAGQYPENQWAAAVATASRLALAHLVRPAETLAAYAFAGEPGDLPASDALGRLGAFGPYPYLPEIAARYVDKKGLERLDPAETERVLRQIDRRMAETFSPRDWLDLVDPLAELAGDDGVPAPLLRDLFASKGRGDLAAAFPGDAAVPDARQRLAEPLGLSDAGDPGEEDSEAGSDETASALATTPSPASETDAALAAPVAPAPVAPAPVAPAPVAPAPVPTVPEAPSPPPAPPSRPAVEVVTIEPDRPAPTLPLADPAPAPPPVLRISNEPAPPAAPEADAPDDRDGGEPLWKRLVRQAERAAAPVPDAETDSPPSDAQEPLWQRFAVPRDAPEAAPASSAAAPSAPLSLDDLEARVLGPGAGERRGWYVSELFGGSADDYRQTLDRLDAARTWTAATEIIARDVFRKHRVNIYTEAAVTFTDAVESWIERRP